MKKLFLVDKDVGERIIIIIMNIKEIIM